MMSDELIARLCELVAPPKEPQHHQGDWDEVERSFGISLPLEYKQLINTFGQGKFNGEVNRSGLYIFSYLRDQAVKYAFKIDAAFLGVDAVPYPPYPANPGLLGFGSYADTATLGWITNSDSEKWDIIYHSPETDFTEVEGWGFLEFVISFLEETSPLHEIGVIRKGNMKGPHTFIPGG